MPESKINVVPTTYARNQANAVVEPLLAAYPLPSAGQDLPGQWTGQFFAGFSNPSTLNATSVRLDWSPTPKLNLFIVLFGQQLDSTQLLAALLSPDGNYLLATVLHGASGATDLYLKDLRSAAPFALVVAGVPATFNGSIRGHTLYVETNWQAGRGRVFGADLDHPQQEHWKLLVPELPEATIEAIALTSDRLVVNAMRNAHSELLVYALDGHPQPSIPLPGIGAVDTLDTDPASPQLNFSYTSFDTPTSFYRWSSGAVEPLSAPAVPAALRGIVVDQVWYASTGGARVPMFLAHRRDVKPDGNLPVLLYGYGGFTWSQLPTFSPEEAVWIERGGVYAVANIRGGSEVGEAWHRDGELDKKQNSFDDFANAGRWLVANHYTRPERLAIQRLSNGGLLVTASITQHPELFAAAIGRYPRARFWAALLLDCADG